MGSLREEQEAVAHSRSCSRHQLKVEVHLRGKAHCVWGKVRGALEASLYFGGDRVYGSSDSVLLFGWFAGVGGFVLEVCCGAVWDRVGCIAGFSACRVRMA